MAGISAGGNGVTVDSIAPRAYRRRRSIVVGTCIVVATRSVAPVSACTSGTQSSWRARTASAKRSSSVARCSGLVRDQAGKASAAALAASATCSGDASGAGPTTSSVAGLTMS